MKRLKTKVKLITLELILLAFIIMSFQSSSWRPTSYEPVMMTRAEMEASVTLLPAKPIKTPGKIWVYNTFILVIEQYRGIHIINNSDPNNPINAGFIRIEGCTDLAVNNGIVYANNAVDLIGVKGSSSFESFEVVSRTRNALPMVASPEPWGDWYFLNQLPPDMIIVRWNLIDN